VKANVANVAKKIAKSVVQIVTAKLLARYRMNAGSPRALK
jgi:hypothetical protein